MNLQSGTKSWSQHSRPLEVKLPDTMPGVQVAACHQSGEPAESEVSGHGVFVTRHQGHCGLGRLGPPPEGGAAPLAPFARANTQTCNISIRGQTTKWEAAPSRMGTHAREAAHLCLLFVFSHIQSDLHDKHASFIPHIQT